MNNSVFNGLLTFLLPMSAMAGVGYGGNYLRSAGYGGYGKPRSVLMNELGRYPSEGIVKSKSQHETSTEAVDLELFQGQSVNELVILDSAVKDRSALYKGLKPGVQIVEIDTGESGLEQLKKALAQYSDLAAVHIVSHASDGQVMLGHDVLTAEKLHDEITLFNTLNNSIREGGDLLFYGCNLASGEKGEALLELISGNTHVDVAASNDLTGAENLGGDWELEIQRGHIETEQPFSDIALKDFSSTLAPQQYVTSDFCSSSCFNSKPSHTSTDGDLIFTGEASGSAENVYAYSAGRPEGGFYLSYQTGSGNDGDTSGALIFTADNVDVYSFELTALVYTADSGNSCSGGSIVGYKAGGGTVTDTITWSGSTNSATLTNLSGVQITHFKVNGSGCSPAVYEVMGVKSFTVDNKQAPNTAPSISNLTGDSVAWAGVGSTVTLDSGGDATVSDTELDALNGGNGDYSGGSLTVQRPSAVTSDVFGFDISGALFTVSGSNLLSDGQTFASFTNTNGTLTISFNSASTAATTALVQDVARHITYRSDTPAGDATVRFTLSDGTSTDTADVTVTSDTIYITNTTDTASIDATDGVSFSEAIAIAAADGSGTQTLIVDSSLAGQTVSASSASSLSESLTLDLGEATGMTLSGGSLSLGGGVTLTLDNDTGDTASISTAFGGTGALTKTGDGTVTLSGTQTYSGVTTFTGGAISVAGDSNLGSGQLVMNGGALVVTSSGTIDNSINLAADSTISHANNLTLSGMLSGTANLSKAGAGQMSPTNSNNEAGSSGGITITEGKFYISDDNFLPSGTITLNGGSFLASGSSGQSDTVDNDFVVGAAGGTFHIYGGGGNYTLTVSGAISGSGDLEKITTAALVLSGANTYSGNFTISSGNVSITNGSNLGTGTVNLSGGKLTVTGSDVTISNNLVASSGTFSNANNVTWSGVVSGSGGLTKNGAGTLTLSGSQTHSGTTNITAGVVSISDDTNIGSGAITLNGGGLTVTGTGTIDNAISIGSSNGAITNANAVTLSGVMSGTGSPTKAGAGTLTLSATNTNTGLLNVSAGSVAVSGTVSSLVTVSSGATLEGPGVFSSLVVVNSGGTIQLGSSPGTMTLESGLTLNSGGTLVARINGATAGATYDQYDVSGTVTLGGTLSVIGTHSGSGGDSFVIINNDASDSVSSTFNGLSEGDATTTLNGKPLTVSYVGSTGNDVTLSIVPPTITAGNISISGASGTGGAYIIGDTVTATWNDTGAGDNNGDITSVTVDFSEFGGGSTVAASNSSNTWTATYTLVSGSVDNTNRNVSVTATDTDGVSGTTADTTNATVDNIAPTISDSSLSISGSSGTSGTYIIGDTVTATWNDTSGGDNNTDTISGVTVDFSAFGGGASVAASNSSDTWTATYTITSGAIDSSNLNVSATATDNAGNTNLANDSTNATVDNQAPTVTDANISISGASGGGGAYIIGDTVTATWNNTGGGDNNSDTISGVTVNFSSFGGGSAVAASNSSDTWTATYTITAGSIQASNLNVSVTATDNGGNAATTSDGTNATVDNQAPSGHSVSFDDSTINNTEASSQSFTFAGGEVGASYSYSISSSGGGTNVTGSGTLASATDQVTGLNLSGLGDGTLTLSVVVTDTAGNAATAVTHTATLDTAAPSGHSVSFDDATINSTEASSQSFTFAGGEVGASYSYTVSSSGGGTNVTGSGTLASTTDQVTGLNFSGLGDGTLTLSVVVTDTAGNAATAVTHTATLDTAAPSGHSVSFDDATINSTEASSQSFTFAGGEVGASYSYTVSSSGGGTNVTGSGTLATATDKVTSIDLSGLGDGTLTLSVVVTDTAGNAATAITDTATLDASAPSGHSVSFDDATINSAEASSQSFTFAGGEVGADYSYTISSSGGGTNVTGSGTLATATDKVTGIDLSGLGDGTLTLSVVVTDTSGNAATAVTDTATLDATAPSGQSVSFDDATINGSEASSQSFTFAGGEVGADYSYTISSSGGGTNVTGSGTLATATDQVSSLDLSGLGDGTLTLSVVVTDTAGNAATAVTHTATLDTAAPSGHSVSFDDATINSTEASSQSFTFAGGEVGASYSYTVSSSGGGTNVTGSGTLATATDKVTSIDLSGLGDGTLTLSVVVTDTAGNAATAVTDTATLDASAPSGHSVSFDDATINGSEASSQSFTFAGGEIGADYSYTISSSGGGTNVTGSGTLATATDQVSSLDLSGLGDGTLTLSVVVTDTAGNAATAVTHTATLDTAAPSGHSVSFDDATINSTEASSQSFTFAGGEVGASYSYTVSSSGGGTNVTGSGTLATATDKVTGIDLSGLGDGTLTLSVVVTDTAGNAATAVTDTATLDTTAASGHSVSFDDATINSAEASSQSFSFAGGEVGASYSYTVSSSGGGTNVTGSGTLATATDKVTGIDLSGLGDGTLTLSVVVTDTSGNAATAVTDTATLDATAPSGHSVSFDDATINGSEASSQSFTFAGGEVGADYSYTISSSGGGTNVTGSGTLATATDQITGIDVSGLSDGTLTLSVTVTDTSGNAATAVTDTATLDTSAASGHSVAFDDSDINATEASSQSFTFAGGEVGADYSYIISSSGGGTNVTGSGTLATATDQVSSLDLSGLGDGTLTLSVVVTDSAGNAATAVTDTATLDTTAASGHSVSFDDATISSAEATSQSFTFAGGEVGASYSYTVSSSGGGTNVTGSGTLATATDQVTGIDLSGLGDGTLTLSVVVTDTAGNAATAVTDTATLDASAPSGHSVSFDDATINGSEAGSQSFTFAGGEVGADYSYTISSSGGGTNVTGSGTLATATDQITGIDVSGLSDGALTLSVVLTDTAGNAATAVSDTTTLDTTAPQLSSSSPADGSTSARYDTDLTLTFNESVAAGSSGDLSIAVYDADDDSLVESNDSDSGQVSISGAVVTVSLVANLDGAHDYYVQIGADAMEDAAGNSYAGISDKTTLNFTTTNLQPTAANDSDSTNEDNSVAISVLDNDSDEDGSLNAASVMVASGPSNGSASVNTGTGVITYTPDDNFNGSDSFTYTVEDNNSLASSAATVTITVNAVNDAPVAVADLASTLEDTPVSIDVADNDTDVDTGDAVDASTITIVTGPSDGSAVVNSGQVDYTPDANFNGTDTFTYTIEDSNGAMSAAGTVTVNVTSVNDLPAAAADTSTVDEDNSVDIDVLDNDSDVDGVVDATTVTVQTAPTHGSTSVNSTTGVITYTPTADFNGSDTFTYTVKDDSDGTSNAATVTITVNSVNDAPVAADDIATLLEDVAHTINVLGNDSDVDGALVASSVEVVTAPTSGGASVNTSTGAIIYTPDSDFNGSDSLTYRVQDNLGEWSAPGTVTLTVQGVNDSPLANDDVYSLDEDTPTSLNVVSNDSDVDGTIDVTSISILTDVSNGALVDNGDGTLTYTPGADFYGSDTFTYMVADDEGADSVAAIVSITVNPVNDAPTITGTPTTSVVQGESYSFTPTLNDVEGDAMSVSASNLPSWLSLDTDTGALTGAASVAGTFSNIVLTVSDGGGSSSLTAFSILVELDTDSDGDPDTVDTDDDNDGMSDSFEIANGLDPLDASDADGDLDGDTISNYQESVDGTNPTDAEDYLDTTAPVVVAPEELVLDAVALFTPVTQRQLLDLPSSATDSEVQSVMTVLASDNVDGDSCCNTRIPALSNGAVLLPPGRNLVTYRAVDRKGNVGTAQQIVNIRPLVSVNKDQISVEGATVLFKVILNGQSPFYPLSVPYVIDSASTASSSDHNLVNGSVIFTKPGSTGQTEASVSILLTSDSVAENDERLMIRLDDRTSNAEDLADGYDPDDPNIYDINSGAKIRHVITIVERNVAPDVTLRLRQGGLDTIQVTPDGGAVTVTATVTDPNVGDTHTYNWTATDNVLSDTDGNTSNNQLVFSPSSLTAGRYKVQLTVADSANATDSIKLYFRVVDALPTLEPDVDTDGDGVDDQTEGTSDTDDDGIPEYLDNISAPNVLPEVASETASYLVECDPGVRCRLGQFAILGGNGGVRLEQDDLMSQPDISADGLFEPIGGIFDFEIHDLPTLGQSVRIVLPQDAALPADGVYRKFQNSRWESFVVDTDNELHSAPGNPGYCPPPGDDSWESGLIEGYYCVQLTIEDGGPNDADGLVNGSVEDPGVVAVDKRTSTDIESEGGGSGGGSVNGTLLLMLLSLTLLSWRYTRKSPTLMAVMLLILLTPSGNSQAADWEAMKARLKERGYLEFGAYHVSGSQGAGDFKNGLESEDVTVSLNNYDVSRYGYQFLAGYRYHEYLAAEIGFLDLGNVKVSMSASALDADTLEGAVEKHYPVSGSGWTLANRFLWPVRERITLSAEVGLYLWEGDIQLSGADINPDLKGDTDPLLGLGASYSVTGNIDAAVRIKRIFFDGQHVDLLGIGAVLRF
ncbi:tandem-95 repeat protein [Hahella aquimaris]|uniref:tandem-95 repeat protein n=1 Tax=Hahella sp. HNIBRBA332 TaxID=3015983 RepID=UPI00273CDF10|nr:tandem-95 repeat protein [Hahella sp. HNIBRBA332]WLQ13953.1 tandem-95 repeat protein [Hahella sp. HNIBRBA332]